MFRLRMQALAEGTSDPEKMIKSKRVNQNPKDGQGPWKVLGILTAVPCSDGVWTSRHLLYANLPCTLKTCGHKRCGHKNNLLLSQTSFPINFSSSAITSSPGSVCFSVTRA